MILFQKHILWLCGYAGRLSPSFPWRCGCAGAAPVPGRAFLGLRGSSGVVVRGAVSVVRGNARLASRHMTHASASGLASPGPKRLSSAWKTRPRPTVRPASVWACSVSPSVARRLTLAATFVHRRVARVLA